MFEDENHNDENFEETLRSIAHEVSESVQRAMNQVDVNEIAESFGVDAERARSWMDTAAGWMRTRVDDLGQDMSTKAWRPARTPANVDPLRSAAPHPLDVPSEEQGLALAALESGRWIVEPGSETLAAHGEGPGPSDALGLVRELRARDWIAADGKLTVVGRHALTRWLDGASSG